LPAIEGTEESGLRPNVILADTAYGSEDNVHKAKEVGVEVISPAGGKDPEVYKVRIDSFQESKDGKSVVCPEGRKSWHVNRTKAEITVAVFNASICALCVKKGKCPAYQDENRAELRRSVKDKNLSIRRKYEETDEFKKIYGLRAGVEALNSRMARETGLKRLRCHGLKKVTMCVFCKVIGINFMAFLSFKKLELA
jgi:hypothetical protein